MLTEIDSLLKKLRISDLNIFIFNLVVAVLLLVIGFFLGRFIASILKKSFEKSDLKKTMRPSFVDLFVNLAKWAIYVLFADFALLQLNIPIFTEWITSILVIFPAIFGALILIFIGFVISIYLKEIIVESKIKGWQILSMTLFYFIFYIFVFFAFRTALISQNKDTVNIILIIFTAVVAVAVAYYHIKIKKSL